MVFKSDSHLCDRIKILLSSSTAVKNLMKLSTSRHCTNGWNDICINEMSYKTTKSIFNSSKKPRSVYPTRKMYKHTAEKQEEHRGRTSTWGSPSFGGASTESRQLSIANKTRSFPGVGRGTLDTIDAIISHNGLL